MQMALTTSAVGAANTAYTAELLIDEPDAWEPPIPGGESGMVAFSLTLMVFLGVLLGAAIVIASALYIAHREAQLARERKRAALATANPSEKKPAP